jgi:hypothetical protein
MDLTSIAAPGFSPVTKKPWKTWLPPRNHLGLWKIESKPPRKIPKSRPEQTERHIDYYSARPSATQMFIVACDYVLLRT